MTKSENDSDRNGSKRSLGCQYSMFKILKESAQIWELGSSSIPGYEGTNISYIMAPIVKF